MWRIARYTPPSASPKSRIGTTWGWSQAGGDRRLAQEAPPEAIVARQFVGEHLQRDPLAALLLLGQVDGATRALADELDDAVAREDRADGQLPAHGMSLAQVQVSGG